MNQNITPLEQGFMTAFMDYNYPSNLAYKPQFVSNNYKEGRKVLSSIENELLFCEEFFISVAFITLGGITPLLQTLRLLEERKIPGRILTTDYLTFSEPKALKILSQFKNIQLKMFITKDNKKEGFHTKGYVFKRDELYSIIVGSSNMTLSALTTNKEWNTKLVSKKQGEYAKEVLEEFEQLWNAENSFDYTQFIDVYTKMYTKNKIIQNQKKVALAAKIASLEAYHLRPNSMQVNFINNLRNIYENGEKRALLISATGTGKTYASAFAMRELNFKRVLFLSHRNRISKQAMESYRKVFSEDISMGLVMGEHHDYNKDFIFATIQTLSKTEALKKYSPDSFEAIVLDEAHHTIANSYQKIIQYFKPKFYLGMTATPERRDDIYDGKNIYEIFNHQIAYEIRLQQAMEEDLLCPFHYFGITDLEIITDQEKTKEKKLNNFKYLTSDERVRNIMKQAEFFGYSGNRVKGLIFCSRIEEAKELSNKFNNNGWRTVVLSGQDSEEKRSQAIEKLVGEDQIDALDYILSVDVFSEGVDVPEINQVIMLRPTTSPIVFVQQLGRGLRKTEEKEYVVILDFIGNYQNNFMVPIALSGDRSYNKDNIRRYLMEGCRVIPGASTIHFDEISKNKIFHSIDQMKGIKEIIKNSYWDLKYRQGKTPMLIDFYKNGQVDPMVILDNYKTYYHFLQSVDKIACITGLSEQELLNLEYVSRVVAKSKRPHEVEILSELLDKNEISNHIVKEKIAQDYHKKVQTKELESAISNLQGMFVNKDSEEQKYITIQMVQNDESGMIRRVQHFCDRLSNHAFRMYLHDLIEVSRLKLMDMYRNTYSDEVFILYEKYSRKDVCQLLNCKRDLSSIMYGMKRFGDDVCIFVTYNKTEDKTGRIYLEGKPDYADEFIDNKIFIWDTQIGRGIDSSYTQDVLTAKKKHLFVKKSDSEGTDFYYMGLFDVIEAMPSSKKDNNGKMREITKVKAYMHHEVREDLLYYFKNSI